MKKLLLILLTIFALFITEVVLSQDQANTSENPATQEEMINQKVVVIKESGQETIGILKSKDSREILLLVDGLGEVVIPMHVIIQIKKLDKSNFNAKGEYIPNEIFSTRYFITTNGLPIEKGENYVSMNLYGPEIQFSAGDNVSLGLMTSWMGTPLVGSVKFSFELDEGASLAIGTLAGADLYGWMDNIKGALPYCALTFGNRKANVSFSGGYGVVSYKSYNYDYDPYYGSFSESYSRETDGNAMFSIGVMAKAGKRVSFIFDSIIVPADGTTVSILLPGLRIQDTDKKAFQFGFGMVRAYGESVPFPMIQWFRKVN